MPSISLTFLDENQEVPIDVSRLEFFKAGGEGRLYMLRHNGRRYLLKALPDNQEIFERMKHLRRCGLIPRLVCVVLSASIACTIAVLTVWVFAFS